jgi:hypothetical protein
MKRFFFALALMLSAFASQALTLGLPDVVKDGDTPISNDQFWCNNDTVKEGLCTVEQVDDGFDYILVHQNGTAQCAGGWWSYININTSTGYTLESNTDTCQPDIHAKLFRVNGKMAIVLIKGTTPVETLYLK